MRHVWIVCGGRDFSDRDMLNEKLGHLAHFLGGGVNKHPELLVHGDARGADRLAGAWARAQRIPVEAVPADWSLGKVAGILRNRKMLDMYPEATVIAFPGGRGTADMVSESRKRGRHVIEVKP